jgi:hypothetical protein
LLGEQELDARVDGALDARVEIFLRRRIRRYRDQRQEARAERHGESLPLPEVSTTGSRPVCRADSPGVARRILETMRSSSVEPRVERRRARERVVLAAGLGSAAALVLVALFAFRQDSAAGELVAARLAGDVADNVREEWGRLLAAPAEPAPARGERFHWSVDAPAEARAGARRRARERGSADPSALGLPCAKRIARGREDRTGTGILPAPLEASPNRHCGRRPCGDPARGRAGDRGGA